jgi:hypothetical protein
MPLTFLQAKAIVCPDKPVVPGTKEHRDILEMMRQSGRVFAEDNVTAQPPAPRKAERVIDFERYQARIEPHKHQGTSKKAWLSIDANRRAYEAHLKEHVQVPVGYYEPEPMHVKMLLGKYEIPSHEPGESKRAWLSKLKLKSDVLL